MFDRAGAAKRLLSSKRDPMPWEEPGKFKEFWGDRIRRLRGQPQERLELALRNLPLPGAFREAAIACRMLVRAARKQGGSDERSLSLLYLLAAIHSFGELYSERLREPGFNVYHSIPWSEVVGLSFTYEQLGYEELELLNKTDRKWLREAWGAPVTHNTLHNLHRDLWRRHEDRLLDERAADRGISRSSYIQQQRELHEPVAAKLKREKEESMGGG